MQMNLVCLKSSFANEVEVNRLVHQTKFGSYMDNWQRGGSEIGGLLHDTFTKYYASTYILAAYFVYGSRCWVQSLRLRFQIYLNFVWLLGSAGGYKFDYYRYYFRPTTSLNQAPTA